jgi:hypothetical protein
VEKYDYAGSGADNQRFPLRKAIQMTIDTAVLFVQHLFGLQTDSGLGFQVVGYLNK